MRNVKICLIVVLGIITLGLCGILVQGIRFGRYRSSDMYKDNTQMHLVLEKEISLAGIDSIAALYEMNNNDVYIYEGDGDTLTVKEYVNYEAEDTEISTVSVNGNSLEIKGKKRNNVSYRTFFFSYNSNYGYTELWLPESYKGDIIIETVSGDIESKPDIAIDGVFEASATSGDISLPSILAKSVNIATTSGRVKGNVFQGEIAIATASGDVDLTELIGNTQVGTTSGYINVRTIVGNAEFSSTSGDISVIKVDGDTTVSSASGNVKIQEGSGKRNVSVVSGDVRLEEITDVFDISATSGEIRVKAQKGEGKIETTSGDVSLELAELTGKLDIDTTSGEVIISLSEAASFEFKADTTSGDIDTFFDDSLKFSKKGNNAQGKIGANPLNYTINIGTTSGDVRITKLTVQP